MECQACGSTTNLIFCGANTVLCEDCSKSDTGKEIITTNRIGCESESHLAVDAKYSSFSFRGRINRGNFWFNVISLFLINSLLTFVLIQDRSLAGLVFRLICLIPSTWLLLATYVKRLHDLDMSAWMVITLFIPFINLLIFIWLGFESGTKGTNDYGEEPTSIVSNNQEPPNHDLLGSFIDNFVLIRGGEFLMGSPTSEVERSNFETQHLVRVNDFYMSKYEVTVAEFKRFITESGYRTDAEKEDSSWLFWNGSEAKKTAGINWCHGVSGRLRSLNEKNHPVLHVSWNDAVAYCQRLSEQTGRRYRLPTEAEWEYTCRAGSNTPFNTGENLSTAQANYDGYYPYNKNRKGQYREYTVAVDSFAPNAWGLYNMHGNVWEWCDDVYGDKYYDECEAKGFVENPSGPKPEAGSLRVLRGGSWGSGAGYCRSASRISRTSDYRSCRVGFRPVYVR